MTTYVLYNPLAASGAGEEKARRLGELWRGRTLEYRDLTRLEDLSAFLAVLAPEDEIVLCGGDGTINRFVNALGNEIPENSIYYFPCGSGNDFWHDLGRGSEDGPARINEYLLDLPTVEVKGAEYRFLNGIGYGIDGYCCEVGDELRQKSDKPVNYASIAVKGLLLHYQPTGAEISVDGQEYSFEKVWLAPTMHGRFYGGGMMPTPAQDRLAADGSLSLMVMHGAGKFKTLCVFPSIFKGEHVKHTEMVSVLPGRDISVRFDRPVALQIDGETILNVSSYRVKCGKAAPVAVSAAGGSPV